MGVDNAAGLKLVSQPEGSGGTGSDSRSVRHTVLRTAAVHTVHAGQGY